MIGRLLGLWFVLAAMAPHGVAAQTDRPTIRTSLDTAIINVGDRIHLIVDVTHAAGDSVVWPDSLTLAPFEVLDARVAEPQTNDNRVTSSLTLTVTAFELGDVELPSFDVVVAGQSGDTLATDSWTVTVESVGLDEDGGIRDVKGPISIARNWLLLWPWVLGALVLIGVAYWLYRRYQRSGKPVVRVPPRPARPPHEIALEALAALENSGLLDRGEYKQFYIGASDIIRVYIEGRFALDAMEMVTDEVVAGLAMRDLDGNVIAMMRDLLESCDLVKFAKHTPSPEASRAILESARQIVEVTRPNPAPAEASVA